MTGDLGVSRTPRQRYRWPRGHVGAADSFGINNVSAVVRTLQFDARAAIAMPLNRERKREGRD